MRKLSNAILSLLLLGSVAHATDTPSLESRDGQVVTVRVKAPLEATAVECDLTPELRGLDLHRDESGAWTGSFALLPNMVEGVISPEVHLYGVKQNELSARGVLIELAGSNFDQEGLATVLSDRESVFVFDDNIDAASIRLLTLYGMTAPELRENTFTLPVGVAPLNVAAISARSTEGDALVFQPEWTADVASVDEEF